MKNINFEKGHFMILIRRSYFLFSLLLTCLASQSMAQSTSTSARKLDLLFVIDNSGSMAEEQHKVAAGILPLVAALRGSDFQINIITTDSPCPVALDLPYTIKTPNLISELQSSLKIGINGSAVERPLAMTADHLFDAIVHCRGKKPWLRADAELIVIVISDEDERSDTGITLFTAGDMINAFQYLGYIPGQTAKVFGFISLPSKPCDSADSSSDILESLISMTNGVAFDICAQSYEMNMLELGLILNPLR